MKKYDFVEIGTCYFDTLIEKCDDSSIGISIEPIEEYLNELPNKKNVVKLNYAVIAPKDLTKEKNIDLYYIDRETAKNNNLGSWILGCNSIGKPHDFHTNYFPRPDIWHNFSEEQKLRATTVNLSEMGLVKNKKVPCITFTELAEKFEIESIDYLKIDVEGYDYILVDSILDYYEKNKIKSPKTIKFETNSHTNKEELNLVVEKLISFGYSVKTVGEDTIAEKGSFQ